MVGAEEDMCYSVYGYTLTSQEVLPLLPFGKGSFDLEYVVVRDEIVVRKHNVGNSSQGYLAANYNATTFEVWQRGDQYGFSFPEIGIYEIAPGSITCYPLPRVSSRILSNFLVGSVLPIWLELKGVTALHASAIVTDYGAVGFLSYSGNGKSSLAAALMSSGYPLLTDDILAVECRGANIIANPGYPYMRLWPGEAVRFLGHFEDLELVHPKISKRWIPVGLGGLGSFCGLPQPLKCVYLLEKCAPNEVEGKVQIVPMSPRDATIELVRHSFEALVADAIGLSARRLDSLSRLAQQIPVRQIRYPSGLEHLPAVQQAITQDLSNIQKKF